jgi:hypothetical protein
MSAAFKGAALRRNLFGLELSARRPTLDHRSEMGDNLMTTHRGLEEVIQKASQTKEASRMEHDE